MSRVALLTLALLTFGALPLAEARPAPAPSLSQTIHRVEQMVWDGGVGQLAAAQDLRVMNVTWEDTGRYKGSSVGPNISDMTIGVRDASGALHPMPVFRFDNFNDKTADIRPEKFILPVGNHRGAALKATSLDQVLKHTRRFLHDSGSWAGEKESLWDKRDSHVLVSAQACFLPIPKEGEATFTPVIYNYQSSVGNPAVLTILATRQGTSIQVVENDSGYMSEALFFNEDGERAPFTAMRQSDFLAQGGDDGPSGPISAPGGEDGMGVVLLIQVPLKQKAVARYDSWGMAEGAGAMPSAAPQMSKSADMERSDVEAAVVSHGAVEGPFTELHDLDIERDTRFPVRVTVQFYKATSNGVVSAEDVLDIRKQIDRVYADGDYVGSLVSAGLTARPTEWVNTPKPSENATWAVPSWSGWKAW
jgi:hypothetical protein